jgi:hypothetical protein
MGWYDTVKDAVTVVEGLRDAKLKQLFAVANPLSIFSYLVLLSACASTPGTEDRTVRQGSEVVEKACTEKPQGYTSKVEAELKSKLPLTMVPEPEVEGLVRNYVNQQPKGSDLDEVLKSHMFYVCQMANNGGWNAETTERVIRMFWDHYHEKSSRTDSEVDRVSQLSVEAVNDPFSRIPQENQPLPPRVEKFSRVRVSNVGRNPIRNVRATVLIVDGKPGRYSLPVASIDNLFQRPGHASMSLSGLSVDLNPGDDREFESVVECNGSAPLKCPREGLAIFAIDNGRIIFLHSVKDCIDDQCIGFLNEFTVRASGDAATSVTKTFLVSRNEDGLIVLKNKPGK